MKTTMAVNGKLKWNMICSGPNSPKLRMTWKRRKLQTRQHRTVLQMQREKRRRQWRKLAYQRIRLPKRVLRQRRQRRMPVTQRMQQKKPKSKMSRTCARLWKPRTTRPKLMKQLLSLKLPAKRDGASKLDDKAGETSSEARLNAAKKKVEKEMADLEKCQEELEKAKAKLKELAEKEDKLAKEKKQEHEQKVAKLDKDRSEASKEESQASQELSDRKSDAASLEGA